MFTSRVGLLLSLMLTSISAFAPSTTSHALVSAGFNKNHHLPQGAPISFSASSSSTRLQTTIIDQQEMMNFAAMKVIENGVPALFTIITILFAVKAFNSGRNRNKDDFSFTPAVSELYNDLYGSEEENKMQSFPFFGGGGGGFGRSNRNGKLMLPKNSGVPKTQYLKVQNLNEKFDSYYFNIKAATQSKASAAAQLRSQNFDRALSTTALKDLEPHEKTQLLQAEESLLASGSKLMQAMVKIETILTDMAIQEEMKKLGVSIDALDPAPVNVTSTVVESRPANAVSQMMKRDRKNQKGRLVLENDLVNVQKAVLKLETQFIQNVTHILGPQRVNAFRAATLGDVSTRGVGQLLRQLQDRPLSTLLQDDASNKSLFVMRFPGDVRASQVKELREEVTAVVRAAKPGDEALLVLESGGGTVTGYGLAAGQLMRFKENGIKLTVCVEQVAASGGYMMCCVADKIVASPMAVLGSIGVISDIPNVYERLKKEGIEFQTVTAGKYKRTLTPTKKVTKTDFEKTKADIENVYDLFKDFVKQNRPSLQIEEVATGETWFGSDALEKGLCDEIKTADTVLTEFVDQGYNVYEIKYTEPPTEKVGQLFGVGGSSAVEESNSGLIGRAIRWLARTVVNEIKAEFQGSTSTRVPVESRYMMKDDTADRIFMD